MVEPPNILIVDDEPEIRIMLRMVLERAGYHIEEAKNGLQAVERCREAPLPDLVVMDINMPILDGIEACRRIRGIADLPVILLTVREEEDFLLAGFSAGAYDFLTKPFRPRELCARVSAQLGRAKPVEQPPPVKRTPIERVALIPLEAQPANGCLTYADLSLDPRTRQVRRGSVSVNVTAIGFQLLMYFMRHPGEVISKESLLREVWSCASPNGNMVEAAIKRLRKELADDSRQPRYIKTVWGVGYKFGE